MFFLLLLTIPIKEEIKECEKELRVEPHPEIYYRLAQATLKDQEPDRAFLYFLQALDMTQKRPCTLDLKKFNEAFNRYLRGEKPSELTKLAGDDPALNFLVATAFANLGDFQKFFELFFSAYPQFKGSFLDFKTRGIIYLRLSQRDIENRERYLKEATSYLERALALNSDDGALYRALILLAKDAKKEADVLSYLERLSKSEAMIGRDEIYPYVEECVTLGALDVAWKILERVKALYAYSRSIVAAEELLRRQ